MRYEEILGSDTYIRRLVEKSFRPEEADDEDFVVVPPNREVTQTMFMRR
jgi:hypothetical protein